MNPGGLNTLVTVAAPRPEDVHTLPEILLVQTGLDICHAIEQLEALRAATVAEIDERAVSFDTLGFRSVKQWLAANTLLEVPAAARILALGRMLARQPEIADAFNAGEISAEHAALIGKFCETPPRGMPNEALGSCRKVLLDAASGPAATTTTVRTCISRLERIFESDELPPSEDTERNEFHASKTLNGRVAVKGDLDAVTGEMLLTALSALTKPRNPMDDPPVPVRRHGSARTRSPEILRRYLDSGEAPIEGGERPHLSLHVNAADLARSEADHEWVGSDGDPDCSATKTSHACRTWGHCRSRPHADWRATATSRDRHGRWSAPESGRTSRTVSKKQRRALVARDHGCAFPGCGTPPAHCEGHHVKHGRRWTHRPRQPRPTLPLPPPATASLPLGSPHRPGQKAVVHPPSTVDPYKKPVPAHNRAGPHAA
ncbi:DUF222 domain-containing protein [Rhodococcus hoagii]|nr:DUF222 domain-containing protein [Prescottella equi]